MGLPRPRMGGWLRGQRLPSHPRLPGPATAGVRRQPLNPQHPPCPTVLPRAPITVPRARTQGQLWLGMEVTWRVFWRVQRLSPWQLGSRGRGEGNLNSKPEGRRRPCGWQQARVLPVAGRRSWLQGTGSRILPREPATDSSLGGRGMGRPALRHLASPALLPHEPSNSHCTIREIKVYSRVAARERRAVCSAARGPILDLRGRPGANPSRAATIPAIPTSVRAARQPARNSPRRAPTPPILRVPSVRFPPPLSTGRAWAQTAVPDSPSSPRPGRAGRPACAHRACPDTGSAPASATYRSPLSSPVPPTRPQAAPLSPQPSPAPARPARKVPRAPRGRPVAPTRTDGRSPPVTCGSGRLPARGRRALAPLPLPAYSCAPSGPVWGGPEGPHPAPHRV